MSRKSPHPLIGTYHTLLRFTIPNWYITGSLHMGVVHATSGSGAHAWVEVALTAITGRPGFTPTKTVVKLRYLSTYVPTVGDVVMIHRGQGKQNSSQYVVGKLANGPPPVPPLITIPTSATGVALINGTQTFLSLTVPNDAHPHLAFVSATKAVTTALTGGQTAIKATEAPALAYSLLTTATAVGTAHSVASALLVAPNTTITVTQTTAMTAGAAKLYARIATI